MNKVIKLLIISDIFLLTGFGLIDPILSIFINDSIIGGSLVAVGLASTLFLLVRSVLQVPFAKYADEREQRLFLLKIGSFFLFLAPLCYAFASNIYHIYFAQIIHGIGAALAYPTWMALFSSNLDKKKESFEWALYETGVGVGTAFAAYFGAEMASRIGFRNLFFIVALFSLVGLIVLFWLDKVKKSDLNYRYMIYKEPLK
jgi:DHA1 family quinolone resistance protein-like MFS transporter